jgi:2-polyprenyl-3-methyl-5-hydroxy-6-metoxy-1,4-benzoquinol methylase
MSEEAVERFYETDSYYHRYIEARQATPAWIARKRLIASELLDTLEASGRISGRHLLDIGCGPGYLLRDALDRGAHVSGIEASRAQAAALAAEGLDVHTLQIDDIIRSGRRFDVVTISHVLEHVSDPVSFLREAVRALAGPSARLAVEVPNFTYTLAVGRVRQHVVAAHLWYFTAASLPLVLSRAGLAPVSVVSRRDRLRVVARPGKAETAVVGDDPQVLARRIRRAVRYAHVYAASYVVTHPRTWKTVGRSVAARFAPRGPHR